MLLTSILHFFVWVCKFCKTIFLLYFVCKTELVGQNDQLEKTFFSWRPSPPNLHNKIWRGTSKRHSALGQITWFLKTFYISSPQSGKGKRFFFLWHWQGLNTQRTWPFFTFTISLSFKLNCLFIFQITINSRVFNGHSKKVFQLFQKIEVMIKNMDGYGNKMDT